MGAADSLKLGPETGHSPRIWALCAAVICSTPSSVERLQMGELWHPLALTQFPCGEPAWALLSTEPPHPSSQKAASPDLL